MTLRRWIAAGLVFAGAQTAPGCNRIAAAHTGAIPAAVTIGDVIGWGIVIATAGAIALLATVSRRRDA